MSAPVELAVESAGADVLAHLAGDVDVTNVEHVSTELLAAVPNTARALVIDLGGVRYLDSAAVELLFDTARRLRRRRQDLRLAVPPGSPLLRVLELTEVGRVAPIHATVADALAR